jgi:hypothetical protein
MTLDPVYRGADEVIVPTNYIDLCGWSDRHTDEQTAVDIEKKFFDVIAESLPRILATPAQEEPVPARWEKWLKFQADNGRYPGSQDWTLLDTFVTDTDLAWLPQIIGSCVMSNTFPVWVQRLMYQIALLGHPMEYLGRNQFGPENYSFYGPATYGFARRLANMRGGDGLYCAPMGTALTKGVIMCNTPKLLSILNQRGLSSSNDFPEPQGSDGARLYRDFGNWKYLDDLEPYLDFPVEATPRCTSAQDLWDKLDTCQAVFICSSEAIHKVGTHKDGFSIHDVNPRDSWAHNMSVRGKLVASDGQRFFRQGNTSWGANAIYNRSFESIDRTMRGGRATAAYITNIIGPSSSPPKV